MTDDGQIQVLIVEDNRLDAKVVSEQFRRQGKERFKLHIAGTLARAIEIVKEQQIQLVMLDLSLPDSEGLAAFVEISAEAPTTPVVILTGNVDESVAVRAIQIGAQDYILKEELHKMMLPRICRYAIERFELQLQLQRFAGRVEANEQEMRNIIAETRGIVHEFAQPVQILSNSLELIVMKEGSSKQTDIALRMLSRITYLIKNLRKNVNIGEQGTYSSYNKSMQKIL